MKSPENNSLGERIRKARTDRQWSLETLGNKVGLTKKAVSKIELGQTREPSARNLAAIASALQVSLNWLLSGTNGAVEEPQGAYQISATDYEILKYLEWLTEQQKEELLSQLREKKESNEAAVRHFQSKQQKG